MQLQKADITRHSAGTGKSSLMTPAIIMGTEHRTVTRRVSRILSDRVRTASNLDIINLFKELIANTRFRKA